MFLDHTQRRATVGRTPLDEWSIRRRDNTQQTNINAPGGIRTHDLSSRAAVDLRLRPRGHWDRHHLGIPRDIYRGCYSWSQLPIYLYSIKSVFGRYVLECFKSLISFGLLLKCVEGIPEEAFDADGMY